MNLADRVKAFIELGNLIQKLPPEDLVALHLRASAENSWFTEKSIKESIEGVAKFLNEDSLHKWLSAYSFPAYSKPRKIGVVMAGNIPMVGFHDFLCVLISGNILYAKLSSQDAILIPTIASYLTQIEPKFTPFINFVDRIKEMDAVIATGSDNTARYFEHYFAHTPHIIRRNRTSVAIIDGEETNDELRLLGEDILQYYGLGCRNVAKLYIPENYDFQSFFQAIEPHKGVIDHHKYANNYDYNKSIYLVNKVDHLDNGFLLITENKNLISPISVLFYETYHSKDQLENKISLHLDNIQCIVSKDGWYPNSIPFGCAQKPEVWDYADNVNTLKFLLSLDQTEEL
jgi:hypothetical protein